MIIYFLFFFCIAFIFKNDIERWFQIFLLKNNIFFLSKIKKLKKEQSKHGPHFHFLFDRVCILIYIFWPFLSCIDIFVFQYSVYNDGSLGNVTLEFPLFCNKGDPLSASTVLADQLTIRVVMGIRNDIQVEGSAAGFSVLVKSSGLLQNVLATLDIIIEKMVRHFKFVFKPNNVINN